MLMVVKTNQAAVSATAMYHRRVAIPQLQKHLSILSKINVD